MIKRYLIFVDGRVQGVGFRSFCMLQAQQRGLTGDVRNMDNGLVEIHVQGEESAIDEFVKRVREGNRFINVTDLSQKEIPVVPGEKRFTYGYY